MNVPQMPKGWRSLTPWPTSAGMTQWLDQTQWWGRQQAMPNPQRMLVDLLEAVAGRFIGRQLTLELRDRRVTLTLDDVRLHSDEAKDADAADEAPVDPFFWWTRFPGAGGMQFWTRPFSAPAPAPAATEIPRVHLDAANVVVDDEVLGDVSASVGDVRVEYGLTVELVTGTVDLDVCSTRESVLAWVQRRLPDVHLELRDGDLLAARRHRWPVPLLVRPTLVAGPRVRIDVVGFVAFGREVLLPERFVQHRTVDVPDTAELELVDAAQEGDIVHVRLRHQGIRQRISPDHIRNAIRDGVTRLREAAFS